MNFKVGDKIRMKKYKSKEEYDRVACGDGWDYSMYLLNYTKLENKVFIIEYIDGRSIFTNYWHCFVTFQIEKAENYLKNKIRKLKRLLKK